MIYFEVRKANGIYLPLSRIILNFCSNLLVHALSDIITFARPNILNLNILTHSKRKRG
jgi:hypothetical protein